MVGIEPVAQIPSDPPEVTEGVRHGHCIWFVGLRLAEEHVGQERTK